MAISVLLDSNILMDLMNDIEAAYDEVDHYDDIAISVITWMEVVVGLDATGVHKFEASLASTKTRVIQTDDTIMRLAAAIRQAGLAQSPKKNIPLPDAIIGATANAEGRFVVTRNPRDFGTSRVRVPYDCRWDPTTKTGTVTNVRAAPT